MTSILWLSLVGVCHRVCRSYGLRAAKLAGPRFVPLSGLVMLPIRYLEWSCSTPLLVLLSALMVDAPVKVTVRVMAFDFLTILAGAIGLTLPFPARIFMTVIACFLAALWVLVSTWSIACLLLDGGASQHRISATTA